MKPTKQIVYLPVEIEEDDYPFTTKIVNKEQQGYFFTPEQLNEYTANVVRQALETAAKTRRNGFYDSTKDEQSITSTFEETCKKFEV
jgi:hypothetical protein